MKTFIRDFLGTKNLLFFALLHFVGALYFQIRYEYTDIRTSLFYLVFIILISACAIKEEFARRL